MSPPAWRRYADIKFLQVLAPGGLVPRTCPVLSISAEAKARAMQETTWADVGFVSMLSFLSTTSSGHVLIIGFSTIGPARDCGRVCGVLPSRSLLRQRDRSSLLREEQHSAIALSVASSSTGGQRTIMGRHLSHSLRRCQCAQALEARTGRPD